MSVSKLLTSAIDNVTPRGLSQFWSRSDVTVGSSPNYTYYAYMLAGRRSSGECKTYCMSHLSKVDLFIYLFFFFFFNLSRSQGVRWT
jgi:hypothetical protein